MAPSKRYLEILLLARSNTLQRRIPKPNFQWSNVVRNVPLCIRYLIVKNALFMHAFALDYTYISHAFILLKGPYSPLGTSLSLSWTLYLTHRATQIGSKWQPKSPRPPQSRFGVSCKRSSCFWAASSSRMMLTRRGRWTPFPYCQPIFENLVAFLVPRSSFPSLDLIFLFFQRESMRGGEEKA